jgi:hypothetical protein
MRKLHRAVRSLAILLLALGLVAGALAAGGDEPQAQAVAPVRYWAPGEMPEYPGGLEYPLGEGMAVNGVEMRISYYEARADADQVRDFYVGEFEHRGLTPRVSPGVGKGWTVSALTEDATAEAVVAILQTGRARSLVLPSIVPLDSAQAEPRVAPGDLPKSDQAAGVLETTSGDRPGEAVVTWQEPMAPARESAELIRDKMVGRGWQLAEFATPVGGMKSFVVEVRRAGELVRFTVSPWPRSTIGAAVTAHFSALE